MDIAGYRQWSEKDLGEFFEAAKKDYDNGLKSFKIGEGSRRQKYEDEFIILK